MFVANFHDKNEYLIHIRHLKQESYENNRVMIKVHRVIKFNQKAWLKSYSDMNLEIRQKAKQDIFSFRNEKTNIHE